MNSSFYDQLNASPFKGVISEVGLGIEFTSGLLRKPGASKTLLYFSCDYAGLEKVPGERAVSLENVTRIATANYERAIKTAMEHEPLDHFFGLAVSGAHYNDRDSHGWVALKTKNYLAYMHFSIPMNANREIIADWSAHLVAWFLTGCFLKQNNTWADHIISYALPCRIDVLYAPGVSDIERMLFLGENNVLAFKGGKFVRVEDVLRDNEVIYSGSFNPPTTRHGSQNCIFEISQNHTYKGTLSLEDLLHRIRMLDLMHKTVIISRAARFIDKDRVLRLYVDKDYTFLVGADAWNATIARHQYPSDDFMGRALKGTKFLILPRGGYAIEQNRISDHMKFEVLNEQSWPPEVSSTTVRNAQDPSQSGWITAPVAEYIKANKLYVK